MSSFPTQIATPDRANLVIDRLWPYLSRIRVLVVLDGIPGTGHYATFGPGDQSTNSSTGDQYFGLSEFIRTISGSVPHFTSPVVTKAHRDTDVRGAADMEHFRFDAHDLSHWDVIFLIGVAGPGETAAGLSDAELVALTKFMNNGGGVFATGDHEDLGVEMCGRVPRVRSMRKWYYPGPGPLGEPGAPTAIGSGRVETTQPGHSETFLHFDDQSDDIPQPLTLRFYTQRVGIFLLNRYPHPLLCGPKGPITVAPDHMHEGEVIVPWDTTQSLTFAGQSFVEYPTSAGGVKPVPQIVAWGKVLAENNTATEGAHTGDPYDVATPRSFGVVGAYDGHQAGVGRVAVDSTWHHFFDINLIGDPVAPFPKNEGFNASADGQAALDEIRAYYRNLVTWLAPPRVLWNIFVSSAWYALRTQPLNMIVSTRREYSETDLLHLGSLAYDNLLRIAPPCSVLVSLLPWFYFVEGPVRIPPPDPWAHPGGGGDPALFDPVVLVQAALGAAMVSLAHQRDRMQQMEVEEAAEVAV